MTDAHLAELILNAKDVPLTDANRRALCAWFRQMAEEMEKGEHWGSRVFTLGRSRLPSVNGKGVRA